MFFENLPYTNFHELNLDWIIKELGRVGKNQETIDKEFEEIKEQVQENTDWIENYDPAYIRETVISFLDSILARMIFVRISDEGYITYYIPENWDSITFNTTGLDIILEMQPEYGHLVLSY